MLYMLLLLSVILHIQYNYIFKFTILSIVCENSLINIKEQLRVEN